MPFQRIRPLRRHSSTAKIASGMSAMLKRKKIVVAAFSPDIFVSSGPMPTASEPSTTTSRASSFVRNAKRSFGTRLPAARRRRRSAAGIAVVSSIVVVGTTGRTSLTGSSCRSFGFAQCDLLLRSGCSTMSPSFSTNE